MPKIFLIRQGLQEQHELLAGLTRAKPEADLWAESVIINHEDTEIAHGKSQSCLLLFKYN